MGHQLAGTLVPLFVGVWGSDVGNTGNCPEAKTDAGDLLQFTIADCDLGFLNQNFSVLLVFGSPPLTYYYLLIHMRHFYPIVQICRISISAGSIISEARQ